MSEGTNLQSTTGTTVALSDDIPATYDSAGYTASTVVFTAISKLETLGEYGATKQVMSFTPVDTGVTESFPGSVDYGSIAATFGYLPSDAGQDLVETAVGSKNRYSLKLTYPLRQGESTAETHYLDVLVTKRTFTNGDANQIRKLNAEFKVCRAPVIVPAT